MVKVSIITVCFNAEKTLESTMRSILEQDYKDFEYIIIDGGSTDGTIDIINRYKDRLAYWISEPDNGIYDAMNKGLRHVTGSWVNFMNAGDSFICKDVLSNIFALTIPANMNVIYGATLSKYQWGNYIISPDTIDSLKCSMPFCHQSSFVRAEILTEFQFDISLKISADFKLFNLIYGKYPNSFHRYDGIIAIFDAQEGVSSVNRYALLNENSAISKHFSLKLELLKLHLKKKLPSYILCAIYRLIWSFNPRYKKV